jgi:hypothetical protein
MEVEAIVVLQELAAVAPLAGIDHLSHQRLQNLEVGFGHARASPLERQHFELDAQCVQLPDLVGQLAVANAVHQDQPEQPSPVLLDQGLREPPRGASTSRTEGTSKLSASMNSFVAAAGSRRAGRSRQRASSVPSQVALRALDGGMAERNLDHPQPHTNKSRAPEIVRDASL